MLLSVLGSLDVEWNPCGAQNLVEFSSRFLHLVEFSSSFNESRRVFVEIALSRRVFAEIAISRRVFVEISVGKVWNWIPFIENWTYCMSISIGKVWNWIPCMENWTSCMNISICSVVFLTGLENWMTFGSNGLPYAITTQNSSKFSVLVVVVPAGWPDNEL